MVKEGTGPFVFPVGDAARYQPVGVNLTANGSGLQSLYAAADAGTAPFTGTGASPMPLLYYNKEEYWNLTPLTTATGTVTINWDNYKNPGITAVSDLRVAHRYSGAWVNEGGTGTGTTGAGSITSASLSGWSPFTLGSISTLSTLPVQLLYFTGVHKNDGNELRWESADATGAATYTLERSTDAIHFSTLQTFMISASAGKQYRYPDALGSVGTKYYRLKITDHDGKFSYSHIVKLSADNFQAVTVYPNPATAYIDLSVNKSSLLGSEAYIVDGAGRVVQVILLRSPQVRAITGSLAKGFYSIKFNDGSNTIFLKQ
ncbi:MAG: T9SS type A sorting domain-containing protein [Ferruginibacter sp.]